ncbi:MAG: efflux RND transporter periplasmic adaptor subunit [Myxococcales bacterium]|nr:efflux RND transporter periplasmic adaptor subunit [Myxococcales bacterium]
MRPVGSILCALLLALAAACGQRAAQDSTASEAPPALDVWTVEVTEERVTKPVVGTGSIAPHKKSDIGPRVDGIIEEILVRVGDRVDADAPLFRTRDIDFQIRVDDAEHALRLARAESQKAKRDKKRVEELAEKGVASSEQLDAVRTASEIASARLGSAKTALERAKQNLADTVVVAPYPGVITARLVDEGVMMRTMLSGNAHVVQLMKTDIVVAIVQVPALHLAEIKVGTPATLHIDGLPDPYDGQVLILNDRVDVASRAFEVRIPIQNEDLEIKPGLFVRAELRPEAKHTLVLERRAVLGVDGNRHVFLATNDLATKRSVEVRDLDAARVEVLSGLVPGDDVLVGPSLPRLVEGTPITIRTAHVDF